MLQVLLVLPSSLNLLADVEVEAATIVGDTVVVLVVIIVVVVCSDSLSLVWLGFMEVVVSHLSEGVNA